jgi:mannose-1-phosphate guanylyltransferase
MFEEMNKYCPIILETVNECLINSKIIQDENFTFCELDSENFNKVPENSIDYAILEKTQKATVIKCDIGWQDVGSWAEFSSLVDRDVNGNQIVGEVILDNVENCYFNSENKLIAAIGIENLIVVDTQDALLITSKSKSQNVKKIYNELKSRGHETYKFHRTIHRPWGTYSILLENNNYKVKQLIIKPGESLSLQKHNYRSEHWVVVQGTAKIIKGDKEFFLNKNESIFVPIGEIHCLSNSGSSDLIIIEIQMGEYLGEDDIIRFKDIYYRK